MKPKISKEMIIKKIDDYLAGRITEKEAAEWALDLIKKYPKLGSGMDSVLIDLLGLDEPKRFQTAKEDLIKDKKLLMGKMQ